MKCARLTPPTRDALIGGAVEEIGRLVDVLRVDVRRDRLVRAARDALERRLDEAIELIAPSKTYSEVPFGTH